MGKKNSRKKKASKLREPTRYKGRFEITRSGVGFVVVSGLAKDVMVKSSDFNKAFHGDQVRVEITKGDIRVGRLQGKIVQVIDRKQRQFVGHIELNRDFAFFIPLSEKPLPDFFIPLQALHQAQDGDKVIVRMVTWEDGDKRPKGEVLEVVSPEMEADMAMKEILIQQGFSIAFPEDVLEASERISPLISQQEIIQRRDMRDVLTFTIDPEDARDFDDALSFSIEDGLMEIGIHIADVSHYMEKGDVLDEEAYQRGTSVYLPDRVVPMLPERLSNELCSLRPHEDKLTYSCIIKLNAKFEIQDTWFGRTVIHSNHRFTYEDVQAVIETGSGLYDSVLLKLHEIAQFLRKQRMKQGAINFSSQEVRFRLDENGKPLGIMVKESKESHQLIEEFMLLANRLVAVKVSEVEIGGKPLPFPYRIHDEPDEEKLIPFIEFAKSHGYSFSIKSPHEIARSFNEMLQKVKGLPEQRVLEQMGIRTMAKAVYTSSNIGHFGLGFDHYCHFTSPIRRYPDILVHRVLTGILAGDIQPEKKMEQYCIHSSERERSAMEAERAANKYKQVEYMRRFIGQEFPAVVSGVSSFGFWAETIEHKCEGLVSCTALLDYDDFVYHEKEYALIGRRSGFAFRIGDEVNIKVIAANLIKRQLDYDWVMDIEFTDNRKGKGKGKK